MTAEHGLANTATGGRTAVILFNLGGPDRLEAVEPFLANLFSDPAIIGLPGLLRRPLARLIARRRGPVAREIYARLGGGSPLLALTTDQAKALEATLASRGHVAKAFIAMRYWHPLSDETAAAVAAWDPERIVLLPLYPQFSTTTTGSSLQAWSTAAAAAGLGDKARDTAAVCCYPTDAGFVAAMATLVDDALATANGAAERVRVLFSAHGLPERVIARGDPYQVQVEATVAAVVARLSMPALDYTVCYQSRVGPLKWIGPATEDELARAARDGVDTVIVVPTAFVSEHSETLVELDIEYRELATSLGIDTYIRVPAVGTAPAFIEGLADLVGDALERPGTLATRGHRRWCGESWRGCPCRQPAPVNMA